MNNLCTLFYLPLFIFTFLLFLFQCWIWPLPSYISLAVQKSGHIVRMCLVIELAQAERQVETTWAFLKASRFPRRLLYILGFYQVFSNIKKSSDKIKYIFFLLQFDQEEAKFENQQLISEMKNQNPALGTISQKNQLVNFENEKVLPEASDLFISTLSVWVVNF